MLVRSSALEACSVTEALQVDVLIKLFVSQVGPDPLFRYPRQL